LRDWKAENLEIIKGQSENWRGPTTDYWPPVNPRPSPCLWCMLSESSPRPSVNGAGESPLPRLLRFELLDLSICPVDLSLLRGHLLLQILFLLLPCLHLIADQGAAEQANGSTNAGTGAGIAGGDLPPLKETCPAIGR
jgi:hypothetical protein